MSRAYRTFFGFQREPFAADLGIKDIMETADLLAVADRFDYTITLGAMAMVIGEVGAGKSTALRWAASRLHPSAYRVLWVTATSGSVLELYRQLLAEMDIETASSSRAVMTRMINRQVRELVLGKKQQPVLIIDEASLLRLDVFTELHTITQFEGDTKPWLPMILAGQNNLADKLTYRSSTPLASRIVASSHLEAVQREGMENYLKHHLAIAGVKQNLFDEQAITAIHQGSGGLFRRANHLARGALVAAAAEKSRLVNAEHVRLAGTELI
jgi:general secretion pathway protein A